MCYLLCSAEIHHSTESQLSSTFPTHRKKMSLKNIKNISKNIALLFDAEIISTVYAFVEGSDKYVPKPSLQKAKVRSSFHILNTKQTVLPRTPPSLFTFDLETSFWQFKQITISRNSKLNFVRNQFIIVSITIVVFCLKVPTHDCPIVYLWGEQWPPVWRSATLGVAYRLELPPITALKFVSN